MPKKYSEQFKMQVAYDYFVDRCSVNALCDKYKLTVHTVRYFYKNRRGEYRDAIFRNWKDEEKRLRRAVSDYLSGGFKCHRYILRGSAKMKKLIEHLMPCAICGAVPKINDIYDINPEKAEHCYKLFCSENGVHNSTGEWFANKYKACQDWNRRQQALGETIETLGNRLKPCPFCGRKMQFHNDVQIGRDGKRRNYLYFLHEDYGINKEESCILDDICMPFSIGAGDACLESGCIGEYATRWNKRAYDENPMHEIKQTLLGTIQPLERTVELLEQRNKELEQENQKLKQMLKKVADDAEGLFEECAEYSPYEECLANEYCHCCNSDCDGSQCKWRYKDDVEKLLKEAKESE